jgi:putative hydrolase of the HAD superfamily
MAALRNVQLIVDATYTGILKPDARAYALCTDQLGVAPTECVFVDDQMRNVDGARSAGMLALWFDVTQPQASCDEARRALALSLGSGR